MITIVQDEILDLNDIRVRFRSSLQRHSATVMRLHRRECMTC